MKRAIVESGREICGLVRVGGWNPKSVWWNDQVKVAVKRKKALGARNEDARERCSDVYKEENRKVKRCIYQSKKEVQEQFGRKINRSE